MTKKTFGLGLLFSMTFIVFSNACFANSDLDDVPYQFELQKLQAAENSFHFLRSYVDYYYLLMKKNHSQLDSLKDAWEVSGWCVGDAHPENFGALLLRDGSSRFTMNDMDDSGPCPVVLDLVRLMVSSRLFDKDTNVDKLLEAYVEGLQAKDFKSPQVVDDMTKASVKEGAPPSSHKIDGNTIIRDSEMLEVSTDERKLIQDILGKNELQLAKDFRILDLVSTAKVGGGSGGLLRYEVLIDNGGTHLHLEMKEEIQPSIYPVATEAIPEAELRIKKAVKMEMGSRASPFYQVVLLQGKAMLVRPRFSGNIGVKLDDQKKSESAELIRYEAYQLGVIHSNSVPKIDHWIDIAKALSSKDLGKDISKISDFFDEKYKELKN